MFSRKQSKRMIFFPFLLLGASLSSKHLYAKDVVDSANRLSQTISKVGLAISVGAICLCGIYYMFGRADANTKLTQCLVGVCCVVGVQTLMSLASNIA